jgi:hypothetical protein
MAKAQEVTVIDKKTAADWDKMCDTLDLRVVTYSCRNAKTSPTLKLIPYGDLFVPEDEYDAYAEAAPARKIYTYPRSINNAYDANMYVRKHHPDNPKRIWNFDDDITGFYKALGTGPVRVSAEEGMRHVFTLTQMAIDLGCTLYGLTLFRNIVYYRENAPFSLNHYIEATAMGYNECPHFAERVIGHWDIDLCMQALAKDRIILSSNMYAVQHDVSRNVLNEATKKYLEGKWGKQYLSFPLGKNKNFKMNVAVNRRSVTIPPEYK